MNELALFAGAGGGILGGVLLGWRTVCAVEIDPYARRVLLGYQGRGWLPSFPVFDDVRSFNGKPWFGRVDVVSGGFPCQDISCAGSGLGIDGPKSGLWREMCRIIGEVRPHFAFVENSPRLLGRGMGRVIGDLHEIGYDAKWYTFCAEDVGAWQKRERLFILAYPDGMRELQSQWSGQEKRGWPEYSFERESQSLANAMRQRLSDRANNAQKQTRFPERDIDGWGWWATEPNVVRMVHGIPHRCDRIRCLGNAQLPQVAALAWRILSGR